MYEKLKRTFDIFGSIFLLLILLPFLITIALAIYFFNGKPIFFKQKRVGKHGFEFVLYKFRSMKPSKNTNNLGNIEEKESLESARRRFKSTSINDERITIIGKFIRSFHLDELPQLLNVIKGEMSIVGPRPDVIAQKADYTLRQWEIRNSMKPGITGLAQVSKIESTQQRIEYDLIYKHKSSFVFDTKILFLTCIKLFRNRSF